MRPLLICQKKVYFFTQLIDCEQNTRLIHVLISPFFTLMALHPINSKLVKYYERSWVLFNFNLFLFLAILIKFIDRYDLDIQSYCPFRCCPSFLILWIFFIWTGSAVKSQIEFRKFYWYPFMLFVSICKLSILAMYEIEIIFPHINKPIF